MLKLNLLNRKGYAIKQWYKNLGEEEDIPLSEVVAVYSQMHPEDRKRFFDFMMESETEKGGISKGRCVFVVPERRTNGIGSAVM